LEEPSPPRVRTRRPPAQGHLRRTREVPRRGPADGRGDPGHRDRPRSRPGRGVPTARVRCMICDAQADTVFIADTLDRRFPAVADGLRGILDDHGIAVRTIVGTKDIWCQDYMPIQADIGELVRFRYEPDYLEGHEHLITRPSDIAAIPEIQRCTNSELV